MKISCPSCDWSIEVEDERIPDAGRIGTCPKCQTKFEVKKELKAVQNQAPDLAGQMEGEAGTREEIKNNEQQPVVQKDTKPCPFCREEILSTAIKCKHCQSMLDEQTLKQTIKSNQSSLNNEDIAIINKDKRRMAIIASTLIGVVVLLIIAATHDPITSKVETCLKKNLKDPGSLRDVKCTKVTDMEAVYSCSYRAKNGFGGYGAYTDIFILQKNGEMVSGNDMLEDSRRN